MTRRLRKRMLKWFAILAILLALIEWGASAATAAAASPRVGCGSTVRWDTSTMYGPDNTDAAVKWAYGQVGPVAGVKAHQDMSADVSFEWQHSMSGGTYRPGQTYQTTTFLGNRKYWVHGLDGNGAFEWGGNAPVVPLRQMMLRLVVEDLGVEHSTSTGTGLSPADRAAIKRICAATASASPVAEESPAGQVTPDEETTAASTAAVTDEKDTTSSVIAVPTTGVGGRYGGYIIGGLMVPIFAYGLLGDRLTALFKRKPKSDVGGDPCEETA